MPGKTLGPEETLNAFHVALAEKRYENAMKYISSSPKTSWLSSKWDLEKVAVYIAGNPEKKIKINHIEYLDKPKTMAKIDYNYWRDGDGYMSYSVKLQKEDNKWKIVSFPD